MTSSMLLIMPRPVITFDQPLWWKSLAIQLSQPEGSPIRRLILIVGAFHVVISLLGSNGHLMAGSGIKELFEMINAPKAVEQILSGKAISRAVPYTPPVVCGSQLTATVQIDGCTTSMRSRS